VKAEYVTYYEAADQRKWAESGARGQK